jgi:hypothetical protein
MRGLSPKWPLHHEQRWPFSSYQFRPENAHISLSSLSGFETVYARVALAGGFLSSVTDRFGLWGAGRGQQLGRYAAFLAYTAVLNPWFPAADIPSQHPGDGIGDCVGNPAARGISNAHGGQDQRLVDPSFRDRYDSRDRNQVSLERRRGCVLGLRVAAR